MRRVRLTIVLVILLTSARGAGAPDYARFAASLDPIALGHAAETLGEAALLRALAEPQVREPLLVAVRAAGRASAPERFIPALVKVACGRDPIAAPEAAVTLREMTEPLTLDRLAVREAALDDLEAARSVLDAGCEVEPRPDISLSLALLSQHLEALKASP